MKPAGLRFWTNSSRRNGFSYIEPPPHEESDAAQVIKYLARYLTGGPISDHRLLAADEREVTFLARVGQTPGGEDRQVPVRLSTLEFTRHWALHVLPSGYTKTRHYGGWSNRRREAYLEYCIRLLDAADAPLSPAAAESAVMRSMTYTSVFLSGFRCECL